MPVKAAAKAAVVIPAFRQPGLLSEAIVSALRQGEPTLIVVVIDGCPMRETREVALTFSTAHPARVFVVTRANGGLSAARNTGVEFALARWPQVEAVMFLDADNRIAPDFIGRAVSALRAAPAQVGWVYPDIDMIGRDECSSMRGEFSFLALLDWNYCDAGGVVRRSLLESGLRFDETLRSGYEDWDFWLQAAAAGFRGRHLPNAGFGYRRRAESLGSAASRGHEILVAAMNAKRRDLLRPRALFALEEKEAPRFAIVTPAGARFASDPARLGETMDFAEMARRLATARAAPGAAHFPPVVCFASPGALEALQDALILAAALWLAQVRLRDRDGVRVFVGAASGIEASCRAIAAPAQSRPALVFRTCAAAAKTAAEIVTADFEILLPHGALAARPDAEDAFEAFFSAHCACAPPRADDWRRDIRPPRHDLQNLYRRLCGAGALAPLSRPSESRGEIGFVIPIHSFGGVEKVVAGHARALRRLGFRPHLFITSGDSFPLTDAVRDSFFSVNWALDPRFDRADAAQDYFGAPTSGFDADATFRADALGLLGLMDVVIDNHSLGAHGLAARLQACGVRMFTTLHLVDRDEWGAPAGHPHIALAYEHAYERFVVVSDDLRRWCQAHGVPQEKILLARNAPSYPAREPVEAVRARRATRRHGPLCVLFLGRLDAQKGLDRLAAVVAATRGEALTWRVIGKPVLDAQAPELGVEIEPPLHDPAALDAAYDWADVLVAPSRFEGAPLVILEARRRGVIVVATRVGAVAEIIGDGGYLIDPDRSEAAIVCAFVERLQALADDRDLVATRWRAALADPPPEWEETTAALAAAIAGGGVRG